jgi:sugar lactone lactonase YvrE
MKQHYPNQIFYNTFLVSIITCLFAGCGITTVKPTSTKTTTTTTTTTVSTDTLPSFYAPAGLAIDATGNIYVADYGNNLIRKITPAGVVSTIAGTGSEGAVNATGTKASFNGPKGIAIDKAGNLYVADSGNDLIREITPAGVVTTLAGVLSNGSTSTTTTVDSLFFGPAGVAVDAAANVYVADSGNGLIRKVTQAGVVTNIAGSANSLTASAVFDNPTGLAIDGSGNIYVANYLFNTISLINSAGTVSTFAGTGTAGYTDGPAASAAFYFPNSVALDKSNNVYVADGINNVIRKITPSGIVSTLAGSGTAGAVDSTGTLASFNGPTGLAVDASGNVYVADSNNNKIRKITPAGKVTTIAGNGEYGSRNGIAVAYRNTKLVKVASANMLNTLFQKPVR